MPPVRRGMVAAWVGSIAALGVADWMLDKRHDGSTLSEATRWLFHTHTPTGRAVFVGSWVGLTAWLLPHICKTTDPHR